MKTCEHCKHWKVNNTRGYDPWRSLRAPYVFRNCVRAVPLWDASEYDDVGDEYVRKLDAENADRKFFAQDGSDYIATVITRNDFGCLEFERLDTPSDPIV